MRTILSWSGGKDCSMALYQLQKDPNIELMGLLVTVSSEYQRISMHGVRIELLKKQAESIGLPLFLLELPANPTHDDYEALMSQQMQKFKELKIEAIAFGDLFLEDIRKYREEKLAPTGIKPLFPLWGSNTNELSKAFIKLGFKTIVTCVDSQVLASRFCGRDYDSGFLNDLPAETDKCGENGEFHTFVYNGPIFKTPLNISKGEVVCRDERFYFCDLL